MTRIGNGGPVWTRLTLVKAISAERMGRLQKAFERLAAATFFALPGHIMTLVGDILPGKRVARLDILEVVGNTISTNPHITTSDGSIGLAASEDVSPILQYDWSQLRVSGDARFLAAMEAMSRKQEVVKTAGEETLIGVLLLGDEKGVFGAIVISDRTWEGISSFTHEDREIIRLYAQRVGQLLEDRSE